MAVQDQLRRCGAIGVCLVLAIIAGALAAVLLRAPVAHVYDDGYFYLQIAWSLAHGKGPTFFPGISTNGFHPLWMGICWLLAFGAETKDALLERAVIATTLLNLATFGLALRFLSLRFGLLASAAALIVVAPWLMMVGTGLETALAALLCLSVFAFLVRFAESNTSRDAAFTAAFAGLAVAARLDLAIALAPVLAWMGVALLRSKRAALVPACIALAVMPAAVWLIFNAVAFGDPVPISARLKIGAELSFGLLSFGGANLLHLALAVGGVVALTLRRSRASVAAMIFIAGQGLYLVVLASSGNREAYAWYFTPLAVAGAIGGAAAMAELLEARWLPRIAALTACAILVASGSAFAWRFGDYVHLDAKATQVFADTPRMRLLAYDLPGQMAYLDGFEVLAADGLTTNIGFQRELSQRGIGWAIEHFRIDAVSAPRLDVYTHRAVCGRIRDRLSRYMCDERGGYSSVEFFSRLDGRSLGVINLENATRIDGQGRKMDLYLLPPKQELVARNEKAGALASAGR